VSIFKPIPLGQTLPPDNIHAVSVSMPKLSDVIGYEESDPKVCEKIKSAYPRFVLHPYLRVLAEFLRKKYNIDDTYEIVLLSSKKAVEIVSSKYYIHNPIDIDEPFGVILVLRGRQLKNVLSFIQHVGANLSSRLAEDYLYEVGEIDKKHEEEIDLDNPKAKIIDTLADAYDVKNDGIKLTPSGMNAMYAALKGVKALGAQNGRNILVQFGWLYLDTMNIVEHYFNQSKTIYDVEAIDELEVYLKEHGEKVSAIVTEYPTNPLLKKPNLKRLKELCDKYSIPIILDSTFATAYNDDIKDVADIYVESLTKFACGNADVLMGAIILNDKSKYTFIKNEYLNHCDEVYIKDMARLAVQIGDYKSRVEQCCTNAKKLVEYFKSSSFIDTVFYNTFDDSTYCAVLSITFKKDFEKYYDKLNFAKGPSLGTGFTLLMPYTYLAHYDYIGDEKGESFLAKCGLPVDLLRISVGLEDIDEIIKEFDRVFN
jgi:cystathionine gamma-synthase